MSKKSQSPEARAARVCRSKIKYKSVKDAGLAVAVNAISQQKLFSIYECGDHFHLTSRCVEIEIGQYAHFIEHLARNRSRKRMLAEEVSNVAQQ